MHYAQTVEVRAYLEELEGEERALKLKSRVKKDMRSRKCLGCLLV